MMAIKLMNSKMNIFIKKIYPPSQKTKVESSASARCSPLSKMIRVLMVRLHFFVLVGIALSLPSLALANNLSVKNFNVYSSDTANKRITFTCDVSWDNSWRNTTNYDAIWVFVKYSTDAGVSWHHASIAPSGKNPSGFTAPSNFEIVVPADQKGFFIERTDLSSGNVSAKNVRFIWSYGQDGVADDVAMASNTINKIFGIEMVYIPQGAFFAGDGNSSSDFHFKQGSGDNDPWYIQNENAITTTNAAADGYYYQGSSASGESNTGDVFLIPASFPKGYQAFYQMKYELTEGQWVGFFNTLSNAAKANRDVTSSVDGGKNSDGVVNRNTISWDSSSPNSKAMTLRPSRAMTYLSWMDLAAYADWAGLRPMTELEFEKSARGKDINPIADEFAWGQTSSSVAQPTDIYPNSDENGAEQIFNGAANLSRNALGWTSGDGRAGGIAAGQAGALRVGIFAESSTDRVTSGGGYYGTMELSGNVAEMVVSLGKSAGRAFLGTQGDGELTTVTGYEGNATNTDWPGIDATSSRGVTDSIGSGFRGGDFQSSNVRDFQISSRRLAAKDPGGEGLNKRYDNSLGVFGGGRLVRTAP